MEVEDLNMGKGSHEKIGEDKLTPLEARFVHEYLVDLSATDAYIRASLPKVVSRKSAGTSGSKMMMQPKIKRLIAQHRDKLIEKTDFTAESTINTLRQLLSYDVRKLFDEDGRPLKVTELSDDMAAAVVGVEVVTKGNAEMGFGEITKLKLVDKASVLDKAMKYWGLFEKDNRQQAEALKEITIKLVRPSGD